MRAQETAAVVLVLLVSLGTLWAVFAYESSRESPDTVELLAREPIKGNWFPQTIQVTRGEKVRIVIRNVDVVSHGFYLPAFDIMVREVKAGEVERVTFTPDVQGRFPFYCSVWCSDHHMLMKGEVVVE
ncbi:MAG: cupredoxin domain-containing protein [Fidelibacterota bacterium]